MPGIRTRHQIRMQHPHRLMNCVKSIMHARFLTIFSFSGVHGFFFYWLLIIDH